MSDERLAEIEARAARATGQKWELREVAHGATPWSKRRVYRVEIIAPQYNYGKLTHNRNIAQIIDYCDWTDHPANAEFIANARQDIPDLLAEVKRLRGELATERAKSRCGTPPTTPSSTRRRSPDD